MQFEALCQVDRSRARSEAFDAIVRRGPWRLATFDGLLARDPMPFSAVLVHDEGAALDFVFERLSAERNQVAVIGYRETIDPAAVVDALHAGAVDYLAWPIDPVALPERLQLAAHRANRRMRNTQRMLVAQRKLGDLSLRERQVLDHLAAGASNKEMAKEIGISPRTVEIHRANMLGKLGLQNSAGAVAVAVCADLVSVSPD